MLIGIHGFKQSGKDTLADLLVEEYGFQKIAFADKLKEALALIFSIPREDLWGSDEQKRKKSTVLWSELQGIDRPQKDYPDVLSIRELMQIFATEVCRDKIPGIWYRYLELPPGKNYVVSDLRFQNEALFLKEKSAILIKVSRPSALSTNHASEAGLEDSLLDHHLSNDASLENFYDNARNLFSEIGISPQ